MKYNEVKGGASHRRTNGDGIPIAAKINRFGETGLNDANS
jgi:hypothetical protein